MLFDNYLDITSKVVNDVLINQNIYITQADLDRIKKIPGVKFDLPLADQTYLAFFGLAFAWLAKLKQGRA